jgi:hypothetical protein
MTGATAICHREPPVFVILYGVPVQQYIARGAPKSLSVPPVLSTVPAQMNTQDGLTLTPRQPGISPVAGVVALSRLPAPHVAQ